MFVKKKCLEVGPVQNKTATEKVIELYLNRTKLTSKQIAEYRYGMTKKHARAVPKRERYFNVEGVLDMCGFIRLVDDAFEVNNEIAEPVVLTVLTSFNYVNEHYTYTLPQGDDVTADN